MTLTGLSTFTDTAEEEALLTICLILLCAEIFFSPSHVYFILLYFFNWTCVVFFKNTFFLLFSVIRPQASQYTWLLVFAKQLEKNQAIKIVALMQGRHAQ